MCNHKYIINSFQAPKDCYLSELYEEYPDELGSIALPHDKEGLCLFHSASIDWKLKNEFEKRMFELLSFMISNTGIKTIDFRGFHFVASDQDTGIVWKDLTVSKTINLCAATFDCRFSLQSSHFAGDFYMDATKMVGIFSIEHCEFTSNFTAIQNATFDSNIHMSDVNFTDLFDVQDARFYGQVNLSTVVFQGYTVWDRATFDTKRGGFCYFHIINRDYTSFKDTVFLDAVQFEQCIFGGDTHFTGTKFKQALHFTQPKIEANVIFKGNSKDEMIFENEVAMEIGSHQFEGTAQLIFENANLVQLDTATKQKLGLLKAQRKVVLGEGTIVYRVSFQEIYDYNELNEIFIQDLLTTIRQYFKRKLSRYFEFIFSKEEDNLVVTFYTDDYIDIDDFKKDKNDVIETLSKRILSNSEKILDRYLDEKFSSQVSILLNTIMAEKIPSAIASQLIGQENLKIYLQAKHVSQIHTKTLEVGTIRNSQFYVDRLNNLDNDPTFNLSSEQFKQLKEQLSLVKDNDRWNNLEKLLTEVHQKTTKEERLVEFLGECGVSIANNLSAGVLMVFLNYLLFR